MNLGSDDKSEAPAVGAALAEAAGAPAHAVKHVDVWRNQAFVVIAPEHEAAFLATHGKQRGEKTLQPVASPPAAATAPSRTSGRRPLEVPAQGSVRVSAPVSLAPPKSHAAGPSQRVTLYAVMHWTRAGKVP